MYYYFGPTQLHATNFIEITFWFAGKQIRGQLGLISFDLYSQIAVSVKNSGGSKLGGIFLS